MKFVMKIRGFGKVLKFHEIMGGLGCTAKAKFADEKFHENFMKISLKRGRGKDKIIPRKRLELTLIDYTRFYEAYR